MPILDNKISYGQIIQAVMILLGGYGVFKQQESRIDKQDVRIQYLENRQAEDTSDRVKMKAMMDSLNEAIWKLKYELQVANEIRNRSGK